ncbi:hypothetical protein F4782DRAFT_517492 [Xylaria castorea]|nr:hypothetical protein F4782DRAFT_517492 [Xylaria castorea]
MPIYFLLAHITQSAAAWQSPSQSPGNLRINDLLQGIMIQAMRVPHEVPTPVSIGPTGTNNYLTIQLLNRTAAASHL